MKTIIYTNAVLASAFGKSVSPDHSAYGGIVRIDTERKVEFGGLGPIRGTMIGTILQAVRDGLKITYDISVKENDPVTHLELIIPNSKASALLSEGAKQVSGTAKLVGEIRQFIEDIGCKPTIKDAVGTNIDRATILSIKSKQLLKEEPDKTKHPEILKLARSSQVKFFKNDSLDQRKKRLEAAHTLAEVIGMRRMKRSCGENTADYLVYKDCEITQKNEKFLYRMPGFISGKHWTVSIGESRTNEKGQYIYKTTTFKKDTTEKEKTNASESIKNYGRPHSDVHYSLTYMDEPIEELEALYNAVVESGGKMEGVNPIIFDLGVLNKAGGVRKLEMLKEYGTDAVNFDGVGVTLAGNIPIGEMYLVPLLAFKADDTFKEMSDFANTPDNESSVKRFRFDITDTIYGEPTAKDGRPLCKAFKDLTRYIRVDTEAQTGMSKPITITVGVDVPALVELRNIGKVYGASEVFKLELCVEMAHMNAGYQFATIISDGKNKTVSTSPHSRFTIVL